MECLDEAIGFPQDGKSLAAPKYHGRMGLQEVVNPEEFSWQVGSIFQSLCAVSAYVIHIMLPTASYCLISDVDTILGTTQ